MVSSNYVHHTDRRLFQGLFLHKRKQLTKKKKNNNKNKQTNNQTKRRGGEEKPTINSNLRRTAVKRRLHEAEAFHTLVFECSREITDEKNIKLTDHQSS